MKTGLIGILLSLSLSLAGCAGFWDLLDAILSVDPAPQPICDAGTVGVRHDGQVCLKYDDGSYSWTQENNRRDRDKHDNKKRDEIKSAPRLTDEEWGKIINDAAERTDRRLGLK